MRFYIGTEKKSNKLNFLTFLTEVVLLLMRLFGHRLVTDAQTCSPGLLIQGLNHTVVISVIKIRYSRQVGLRHLGTRLDLIKVEDDQQQSRSFDISFIDLVTVFGRLVVRGWRNINAGITSGWYNDPSRRPSRIGPKMSADAIDSPNIAVGYDAVMVSGVRRRYGSDEMCVPNQVLCNVILVQIECQKKNLLRYC